MRTFRYSNKRLGKRGAGGRFAKITAADVGIGGTCPVCRHFLLQHYDGDPRDEFPDPRKFRYRCFTCEPETEAEKALAAEIEAAKPKQPTLMEILTRAYSIDERENKQGGDLPPER